MEGPSASALLLVAGLMLGPTAPAAAQSSPKVYAHHSGPLRRVTLDLSNGTLTRGAPRADRAPSTIADLANNDLSGFVGVDTGGGFCEWFEAGVKGFRGNASDLMSSIVFAYCSSKLSASSGGPGGTTKLGFYEGYVTRGGTPTTAVAVFTLTGLPANTASSSFFRGFRCFYIRIVFDAVISFADGPIGYSWRFLDNGTSTMNPIGGVLAGTWPYLSCVASCSYFGPVPDGQGMLNMLDQYCPPGSLRPYFSFGTSNGSWTSISMDIEEVTDQASPVNTLNSAAFPNPDTLVADAATIARPWSAALTLGLARTKASSWVLFFGNTLVNPPDGIPLPSGALNFGADKAGRMLLCSPSPGGPTLTTAHGGIAGSTSSTAPVTIPARLALVCRAWCAQAIVLGPVAGDGNARLSSAVSGTVGSTP